MNDTGIVYLVHFQKPYRHARHYLGFTDVGLTERFKRHTANSVTRRGSALMRAVMVNNIPFKVVRIWQRGDRTLEKQLKGNGHSRRCPVCKGLISYELALDYLADSTGCNT